MRIESATLPAKGSGDDRIFTTDNAVIVLDGASAFLPVPVPAATYAHRLGERVRDQLADDPAIDLTDALAQAIADTARALDLSPGHSPTSTVAVARHTAHAVDFLVLGDTNIYTPSGPLADDRLDGLDLAPRHEYRRRLAEGTGHDEHHRDLLRTLQEQQAQRRNRQTGYWIAEADPHAAEHAITSRATARDTPWAVLATDGAYETMHHLGFDDWSTVATATSDELRTLLQRCYHWEEHDDPNAIDLPRSKRHDDKAIAAVTQARTTP